MRRKNGSRIVLIGAVLAVGCTKQVELARSPFMTPLPEGKRPANAAPADAPAAGPADPSAPGGDSVTAKALEDLKREGRDGPRPVQADPSDSPAVLAQRERAGANPRSAEAQLGLARAYHHERIFDLALRHYELARELDVADPEIGRDMGRLWVDAGAPDLALPYLTEATRARPDDALAWSYRGIALDMLRRYPEAEEALRKAVALDPRRWDYENNLGYDLLLQRRFAEAASEFARGLALAPDEPALLNNLGLAVGFQGLPDSAFAAFREAGPDSRAWNNLGIVRRFHGDTAGAVEAFERAARLDPGSLEIAASLRESRRRLSDEHGLQALAPTGHEPSRATPPTFDPAPGTAR